MEVAERSRRAGFSLRLEQGLGHLVLTERRVADLLTVEELDLALREVPSRLDMTAGVERFRHHRTRLERVVVHLEDQELGRLLRRTARDAPLLDLEVRAVDGDLVVLGEIEGEPPAPFLARARPEPAGVAGERTLLISFYELRIFGPARVTAPQLATMLLRALGLAGHLAGPTAAVVDPIDRLLYEICAELGWKVPARENTRLAEVRADAGRLSLVAAFRGPGRVGPRRMSAGAESTVRLRRFLADYEAKTLFSATEALVAEGQLERAVAAYERQLEVHPEHPFLVTRLLQLLVARQETLGDAVALARSRLDRFPDDPDALTALAVVQALRGQPRGAAETLERIAAGAEARGDALEAAQARCAVAAALAPAEPRAAIRALEGALQLRRRLPGALRALADLHARVGDWAAALRVRERLLAGEPDPDLRRRLLHELGQIALDQADDVEAAVGYFERALEAAPEDVAALLGVARAQESAGRILPAVRTLDRAAQLLQQRGDAEGAARAMVRLGDLWRRIPEGGAHSAALRYRQALLLDPGSTGALLGLAEAAAAEGEPGRARGHLEEVLRLSADGAAGVDRAAVYLRLGRLLAGPLEDPAHAVTCFQKALSGRPAQVDEALGELERLHAAAGRWDDVARVLEVAADRASDPEARGARLAQLAAVLLGHLEAPDRAARLLDEAARLRPNDLDVLAELAELHRARGRRVALAEVLGRMVERCDDPDRLATLYAERGDLFRLHLNRTDDAAAAYGLALGCDPDHRGALEGLADIYRERERFPELAQLLARFAAVAPERGAAGAAWLELGRLQVGLLERPQAAVESFERALAALGEDAEALRRLGDLQFAAGRTEEAVERYRQLHALYEREGYDEPAGPFLLRLAEALDGAGRAEEALQALRQAAQAAPDLVAAYEQAQDVLLRAGDVEGIVEFFRAGLARAARPVTRVFLARRAGRLLWRELRRPDEAAALLDEALRLEPEAADTLRVRLEVATALADWPRVAELLRAQLEQAPAAARPALLTRLAELAYDELARPEEGHQLALAALEEDSGYVPALTLLGEQAYRAADWQHARTAYAALVRAEGPRARPDDVLRLAVAELYTGDAGAALGHARALLAAGHDLPDLIATLAEACLQLGDADGLAEVLARRIAALGGDGDGRARFLRRAAALLGAHPGHAEAARACWTELLALLPDDEEARAALPPPEPEPEPEPEQEPEPEPAQELELEPPPEPALAPEPPPARRAVESGDESVEAVAQALAAEALAAETPADRAAAWLALAEHRRDRMHDPEAAMEALRAVLDHAEPDSGPWTEAMEALEDIYAVRGDWDALLALYDRRLADGVGAPAEIALLRASILRAAGRLDEAITAAEAALPAGERALDLLVGLLESAGRVKEAADHLVAGAAELAPEDAAHRYWRAADLLSESAPEHALAALAAACAASPEPMVVEEWLALAREVEAPEPLAAALEARAGLYAGGGVDAVRRSGLLLEAATLCAGPLAEPARARRLLEESLAAWPDNADALARLGDVLDALGDEEALAEVLSRQIAISLPGPHRGRVALDLARLHLHRRHAPEAARAFADMAAADLAETADAEAARRLMAELDGFAEEPEATVDLEQAAPAGDDGPAADAAPPAVTLADEARGVLGAGDDGHAAAWFEAALRAHPDDERLLSVLEEALGRPGGSVAQAALALRVLARARRRRVDLDRLRRVLDARVDATAEPAAHAGLLALRGELWRTGLGHVERARADLEAAVAADGSNPWALLGLGSLAADRGEAEEAAALLGRALTAPPDACPPLSAAQQAEAERRLGGLLDAAEADGARRALDAVISAVRASGQPVPEALARILALPDATAG